jgi:hypothetical protein
VKTTLGIKIKMRNPPTQGQQRKENDKLKLEKTREKTWITKDARSF